MKMLKKRNVKRLVPKLLTYCTNKLFHQIKQKNQLPNF